MKFKVSKKTEAYLKELEKAEKSGTEVKPYHSNPDAIDQLITENDLKIQGVHFYLQLDMMLVVLSSKKVLKRNISNFEKLKMASLSDLESYELSPMGIHWPKLDEDLSLRGFLKYELAHSDKVVV